MNAAKNPIKVKTMASKIKIPRVSFLIDQPKIKISTMRTMLWQRFLSLLAGRWSYAKTTHWSFCDFPTNTIHLCIKSSKKTRNSKEKIAYIIDELNHEYMHSLLLQFISYKSSLEWNNADRARVIFNVSSWKED